MKKNTIIFLTLLMVSVIFYSCKRTPIEPIEPVGDETYIFISHTRTSSNPYLNSLAEAIDYSKFDMIILGGDIATLTTYDTATIEYANVFFNFGDINTIWTPGNHDYTNPNLIKHYTKRELFYTYNKSNITFVVFDTQDSISNITYEQLKMFNNVVDTISESHTLILLTHKLIWMRGNDYLEPLANSVSNGHIGDCGYCINSNNFYQDIYPKLISVKERGIAVYCLAGDIGGKVNSFYYQSNEGINFLASGINFTGPLTNQIVIIKNIVSERKIEWYYKPINNLSGNY